MSNQLFINNTDQETRRRVEHDSYLTRAQAEADQVGGRFRKEVTTTVNAVPQYPKLPASSPWASGFDQNVEPVLGYDVNAQEPTGTPAEVQASLNRASEEK
jgi:hypothetical protein